MCKRQGHNRLVVDGLKAKGAVFVEELTECPDDRPVVFSAHGVPKVVPAEAARRDMTYVDATCPLVSKVHAEAQRHARQAGHEADAAETDQVEHSDAPPRTGQTRFFIRVQSSMKSISLPRSRVVPGSRRINAASARQNV